MDKIEKLIQCVQKTQHGFLDIQKAANEIVDQHSAKDSLYIAKQQLHQRYIRLAHWQRSFLAD